MTLTLHYHPLSSFCWKALVALYENDTPFERHVVNLGDPAERAEFLKLWPIGKFPVLEDHGRGRVLPESTIIIEYLAEHFPGRAELVPAAAEKARQVRFADRFYDLYVHIQMQKITGDRLRPAEARDAYGVEEARARIRTAYDMIDREMRTKRWAAGDDFTLADCAACPALFYGRHVEPFGERGNVKAYLDRLMARPSFARVLKEAEPYFDLVPGEMKPTLTPAA
jgi:glutathione S-transferase